MKFLHTADWHLGKTFHERNLLDDQKHFLEQLKEELYDAEKSGEPYDALLVSGDIFDKKNPFVESLRLFSDFFTSVHKKFPSLELFFISGNHDDAVRLSYGKEIIEDAKIHISTDLETCHKPFILKCKDGSKCAVFSIPFVYKNNSQTEILSSIIKKIESEIETDSELSAMPKLALAHLTAFHSEKSEYDDNVVGTIENVPTTLFDVFDYTALGHIHKKQKVAENVWYSGSPLTYYFDDKNSGFMLSVKIENGVSEVTEIPVKPLHPVVRLSCSFEELLSKPEDFVEKYRDCYIEFQYTDDFPPENAVSKVRSIFPLALSFVKKDLFRESENFAMEKGKRQKMFQSGEKTMEEFFDAFVEDVCSSFTEKDSEEYKTARKELIEIAKEVEKELSE